MKEPDVSAHMEPMTKRLRLFRPPSPFTGASRADISMLRTLAYAVQQWESKCSP